MVHEYAYFYEYIWKSVYYLLLQLSSCFLAKLQEVFAVAVACELMAANY